MPAAASDPAPASLTRRALSRPDRLVFGCLLVAAALAWWWLTAADHGAHMAMAGMTPDVWSAAYLGPAVLMWMLMMAAMMLPSAAPMILLYARFARHASPGGAAGPTAVFAGSYLVIWGLFSVAAALAQATLISLGALSPSQLSVDNSAVAGALLLLAALYQLSPVKRACLAQCRSPLEFVMRLWRPGAAGAARLGAAHGLYCVGCCWALMLLLFVGGVMDLAWIAGLAAIVLLEKLLPPSWPASGVLAAGLAFAAAALLVG